VQPRHGDGRAPGRYRGAGVNRLSLGVQSMVPHVLAALGRTHDPANVVRAVASLATPTSRRSTRPDLRRRRRDRSTTGGARSTRLALDPPHVSAYALTVERARPGRRPGPPSRRRRPGGRVRARRRRAHGRRAGNYEISNWARPGTSAGTTSCTGGQGDYLGFGCAAHSHQLGRRWWNVRTPERYIALVRRASRPRPPARRSTPRRDAERAATCAPHRDGRAGGGARPGPARVPRRARGDRVVLTRAGRLVANDISTRLR
jgi:oxygen-independent coproporphyrinogen-3 oxidase